ncbi:phospholipase A [Alkalimarinus alittae]|uniref:Phospholipase A1 n=1 Tax=Alkalimarinus alittae TaxID=2961619 RepID=A0ABY6N240_9ALTE|nr:phospholipase A [Alkalimarinus alittae]UZE96090.1 phospholipase A [Alkalimarinus alittae]
MDKWNINKKCANSYIIGGLTSVLVSAGAMADEADDCILEGVKNATPESSLVTLKENCERLRAAAVEVPARLIEEKNTEFNPFVITPHRQNYILAYSYIDSPNQQPYQQDIYPGITDPINNEEIKLQLSLKVPLTYSKLLYENDGIYFGFTLKSFWQLYSPDISAPFRETNYRPEIYYETSFPFEPWNGTLLTRVGIEHESNGRSQLLSRSWNRIYAGVGFAQNNWSVYVQPWYRIPEQAKVDDGDPTTPPPPKGDDNPDIEDYLGHYELHGVYSHKDVEFTGMTRYNFEEGNGAIEVGVSFPLWGRLKGYVQYYNGYGESLIDYNYQIERIGIGIMLTDML